MRFTIPLAALAMLSACSQQTSAPTSDEAGGAASPSVAAATRPAPAPSPDPSATPPPARPDEAEPAFPPITPAGFAGYIVGNPIPMAGPDKPVEEPRISETCRMYKDRSLPDVWIMTDGKGVVQRVTALGTSQLKTAQGIGIGATEAQLRAAYPGIRKERSEYVFPPGGNMFTAPEAKAGLRFDLDETARVVEISGGAPPFIGYSEGCA